MAFGLGVLPLAMATGAGAGAEHAIGTGVFGGMLGGTFLGIFFIPLFFMVVQRLFHSVRERRPRGGHVPRRRMRRRTPSSGARSEEPRYGAVYHRPAGEDPHGA